MSIIQKIQKLRLCFNGGYNIPQFCLDYGYKYPLIISESEDLLFEIYTQFGFYKMLNASYRIIGN